MDLTVQIVLLMLTAILAVIGVLAKEYRSERTGKVTTWGKWVIGLAIIGFAMSVFMQIRQTRDSELARLRADRETQRQLNEIRRAVHALSGIQASFAIRYPLPTDGSSVYRERVAPLVRAAIANGTSRSLRSASAGAIMRSPPGVVFDGNAELAPRPSAEVDEATTIDLSELTVGASIMKPDVAEGSQMKLDTADVIPDVALRLTADARRDLLMEYYLAESDELMMWTPLQEVRDYKNAVFRSVQDLLGARLSITMTNTIRQHMQAGRARYIGETDQSTLKKMRDGGRLVWLHLHLSDWGDICISEQQMHHDGNRATIELPLTMEALRSEFGSPNACQVRF